MYICKYVYICIYIRAGPPQSAQSKDLSSRLTCPVGMCVSVCDCVRVRMRCTYLRTPDFHEYQIWAPLVLVLNENTW